MPWYKQATTWTGLLMVAQVVARFAEAHGTAAPMSLETLANGVIAGVALIVMRAPITKPKP